MTTSEGSDADLEVNSPGHGGAAARSGIGPGAKLWVCALALLFAGELGASLWDWRRVNRGGFWAAAIHTTVFLAFFWLALLLVAERFSRMIAWVENRGHRVRLASF